ncbi:hypothetical protein AB1K62_10315 [Parasphingorhabdus sp. JC815]|uniref:hypothetical protein n=1 Tax=Parasphingorhabdus sp. JC815 TaxID=3232140 RepID=UPI00345A4508
MDDNISIWHRETKGARKRSVRMETIGKTFLFYENEWRSEAYYFGDLVYRGLKGGSHIFGLEDGIKARPHWQVGFIGSPPAQLSGLLPKLKRPALGRGAMAVIAILCLVIVYLAAAA